MLTHEPLERLLSIRGAKLSDARTTATMSRIVAQMGGHENLSHFWVKVTSPDVARWQVLQRSNTSSLTVDVDSLLHQLQEMGVLLNNPDGVRDYLLRFPDMLQAVRIVIKTAREFLPAAQLALAVHQYPDSEDEYLVVYARFKKYGENTMEQIRKTRRAYRPYIKQSSGWIILTTDFKNSEW
ncbi:MAG: hypothetical protein KatS3mg017_0548 [Fimbriimonadales bacterium]|nr:MAG: hypothetical protein KatS3mg017_0548 [Fimbriimonadales bacterium]